MPDGVSAHYNATNIFGCPGSQYAPDNSIISMFGNRCCAICILPIRCINNGINIVSNAIRLLIIFTVAFIGALIGLPFGLIGGLFCAILSLFRYCQLSDSLSCFGAFLFVGAALLCGLVFLCIDIPLLLLVSIIYVGPILVSAPSLRDGMEDLLNTLVIHSFLAKSASLCEGFFDDDD